MEDSKEIINKEKDEEINFVPFLDYLQSEKGHEVASRVLKIFEDLKKAAVDHSASHAKFEKTTQVGVIMAVVTATAVLTYFGKFESSVGVLFGTLVGYLFGKK